MRPISVDGWVESSRASVRLRPGMTWGSTPADVRGEDALEGWGARTGRCEVIGTVGSAPTTTDPDLGCGSRGAVVASSVGERHCEEGKSNDHDVSSVRDGGARRERLLRGLWRTHERRRGIPDSRHREPGPRRRLPGDDGLGAHDGGSASGRATRRSDTTHRVVGRRGVLRVCVSAPTGPLPGDPSAGEFVTRSPRHRGGRRRRRPRCRGDLVAARA